MIVSPIARIRDVCGLAVILLLLVTGTGAQTTGTVHGIVADRNGQPVIEATVSLEALIAGGGRLETSTDGTGLSPGQYSVTANKESLGGQVFRVLVLPGGSVDVRFVLEAGRIPAPWLRALPGSQAGAAAFEAGVRASRAGDFENAIVQFEAVLRIVPTCVDCYFNVGVSFGRLDRYGEAEAAFRNALSIRSDFAAAYYGLAEIYSKQNRPEEAAVARGNANRIAVSSLAAGRALAQDTLSRGIAFWNSDNTEDAVRQFREALEIDATMVEPHYWLGLAYEASGDSTAATQAFSRYLGTAPDGEHADEARRRFTILERGQL